MNIKTLDMDAIKKASEIKQKRIKLNEKYGK
jgi:hypothetical protein